MKSNSSVKIENRQIEKNVFEVWKNRGETLAVLLERFRLEENFGTEIPITYAGRLDPMAEGKVLLLVGDARFEKHSYMAQSKTYKFTVLFGVATDTYDVLGKITDFSNREIDENKLIEVVEKIKKTRLPYPMFSSKTIKGKPLFLYARENRGIAEMPMQNGQPQTLEKTKEEIISLGELIKKIVVDIQKVKGDFRQQEIILGWQKLAEGSPNLKLKMVTFTTIVPSGTYIRSIAHYLGEELGIPALAYSIVRTKIGDF